MDAEETEMDVVELIRSELMAQRAATTATLMAVLNFVDDNGQAQELARGLHTIATALLESECSDEGIGLSDAAKALTLDIAQGVIEQAHALRVDAAVAHTKQEFSEGGNYGTAH